MLRTKRAKEIEKIGHEPGQEQAKKDDLISNVTTSNDSNSLYFTDATAIIAETGPTGAGLQRVAINTRIRNMVYFGGIRWRQYWRNTTENPMIVRWAVVSPKSNSSSTIPSGFFKAYDNSRDQDFSSSMSSLEKTTFPISRDKLVVHYEGKEYLGGGNGTITTFFERDGKNICTLDKYFPIKRQVRFNDDADQACEDKVFVLWWATPHEQSTTTVGTDLLRSQTSIVSYFREPGEYVLSKLGVTALGQPGGIYKEQTFKSFNNY